jgi:hypothetical protein
LYINEVAFPFAQDPDVLDTEFPLADATGLDTKPGGKRVGAT